MDDTERRVLDETVAHYGLPPGPEADAFARETLAFDTGMLAARMSEFGQALAEAAAPAVRAIERACSRIRPPRPSARPSNQADGPT